MCACQKPLSIAETSKAELHTSSMDIYDGGEISIEISSNANSIKVVSINCDYPLSNPLLGEIRPGAILDLESVNHRAMFSSGSIHIPHNKEMTLGLVLEDMDRNERHSFEITFAFWNTPAIFPEEISVGMKNITVSCDET